MPVVKEGVKIKRRRRRKRDPVMKALRTPVKVPKLKWK